MLFQHMLVANLNENFDALRFPLFSFADSSHLNYKNIHGTAHTVPSTQNILFAFLKTIKQFCHAIANSSGAVKIKLPHSNNLWCNSFLCNGVFKGSRKSALKVDATYSTSEAYSLKITSIIFYYTDMSLKSMFSHRMLQSGFNAAGNTPPEHSSLRTSGSQTLFTQFLSDLRSPFCEISSNDTNINSTASTLSRQVREGSGTHPIQLGMPFLCRRQRTSSEHSDDIYFLESTDDSESTDNETNEPDDSKIEEESGNDWRETEVLRHHNIPSSENEIHFQVSTSLKKVRFNLNPEIHIMYAWNFAYRSARKGNWEAYARDRTRFQQRIQRASLYLDPILSSEHRNAIYKCRFADQSE